jgi:MoaA/NifB/PqqE/SkfB family radical SAM enzyme
MAGLVMELTNRCQLRCLHCFDERHAASGELAWPILEAVLREGKSCGIGHLAFTGGEPTLHRQFAAVVRATCAAGYTFSFVSNGVTLPHLLPLLLQHRHGFRGVTFSLDGAREATHNRLRGPGSYRRVMQAASLCMRKGLPFTFNMVLTAYSRPEVPAMVTLATRLGAAGVRFGWLMPTHETARRGLDLSPRECRAAEAEVRALQRQAPIAVGLGPGHFSAAPFFPCGPLELEEYNLNYRGELTLCCQLSGYTGGAPETDVVGDLREIGLAEAVARFRQRVARYLADKRDRLRRGAFGGLDHFPCWYCVKSLGKAAGLSAIPGHPWAAEDTSMKGGGHDADARAADPSAPGGGRYGPGHG